MSAPTSRTPLTVKKGSARCMKYGAGLSPESGIRPVTRNIPAINLAQHKIREKCPNGKNQR